MDLSNLKRIAAGLAVLTVFCQLTALTYASDKSDPPDYIGEFRYREKDLVKRINNPKNTSKEYSVTYHDYLIFLDEELNAAYELLMEKLQKSQQEELRNSQRKWLKFRDAEFEFINNNWTRDSFSSSEWISLGDYRTTIVRERVMQLLQYALNH